MKPYNLSIIPAATILNATITSLNCQLYDAMNYSIQIAFTGTPTGSFKLQGSDDPVAAGFGSNSPQSAFQSGINAPVHWTDLPNTSQSVTAAGSVIWQVEWPGYSFVRAVYTDTSGGSSTAIITSARINTH